MTATASTLSLWARRRCPYRAVILIAGTAALLCVFWFTSRYPQLFKQAAHVGQSLV